MNFQSVRDQMHAVSGARSSPQRALLLTGDVYFLSRLATPRRAFLPFERHG